MSKREVTSSETAADQSENDETVRVGAISETDEQIWEARDAANETWFPDLKTKWREADPLTAPLLSSARIKSQSWRMLTTIRNPVQTSSQESLPPLIELGKAEASDKYLQPGATQVPKQWFRSEMLAALPFHHLIPAEKLTAAFAAMPISLVRPQTIGDFDRRRQFFWQSLAAAGVSAKEATLLDDSLHCHLNDSTAGRKIEIDWEVLYYDELQGSAEMYRAELLVFKRRIYEAGDDLRGILELKADEFLGYLNALNFNTDWAVDSATDSEACAVIETYRLERWFMDNLTGSFSLTVSELRNENKKLPENDQTRKTRKIKTASDYTGYRTHEAKRIESWMFSDGDEDTDDDDEQLDPHGAAEAANFAVKSASDADVSPESTQTEQMLRIAQSAQADQTNQLAQTNLADETDPKDLNEPTHTLKAVTAANFTTTVSTAVYRLQLADYWLDWQAAARTAKFDFDLLESLTDARAMRFYELTKLWRLRSVATPDAIISDEEANVSLPDTLDIEYEQFVSLMPLPLLHYERQIKEQLKNLIKPLKAGGYVVSFAVKSDWRGLNNASRLVFKFNDHFRDDCHINNCSAEKFRSSKSS